MARTLKFDKNNVPIHPPEYRFRRFLNWFPLGFGYASLMFMRYCLNPAKSALGDELMDINEFGFIFGIGAIFYFIGFMVNGVRSSIATAAVAACSSASLGL